MVESATNRVAGKRAGRERLADAQARLHDPLAGVVHGAVEPLNRFETGYLIDEHGAAAVAH